MIALLQKTVTTATGLLFPPICAGCRAAIDDGYLCAGCARRARRIKAPFCAVCSQPFDGAMEGVFQCLNCQDRTFHYECTVASRRARGIVRHLIHEFKYNHREYLRRPLTGWLRETLVDERIARQPADGLVPVPLHSRRERERGYNQAQVLAELLGNQTGLKVLPALLRVRHTETQTSFDREERMENLRDAFRLHRRATVRNLHLLLVDDVLTTGSTLDECARVLREAGAASVRAICVARG